MNSIKFFSTLIVLSISCSVLADPPRDIRAYEKKEMLGGSHIQIVVEHKSSKDLTQHFIESVKVVYKDKDTNTEYVLCDETFKKQRNNAGHLFDISNKYDFGDDHLVILPGAQLTITAVCNKDPDKPLTKVVMIQETP